MLVKQFSILLVFALLFSSEAKSNNTAQKDSIQLFLRNFKYSESLVLLDKALLAEPLNKDLYASKGFVLRELYSYDNAIKAYSKALALDSTDQQLLSALANTYKLSQDYPNAVRYYTKALAKDSTNKFLQLETATCKLLNDQFEDAISAFWNICRNDRTNIYCLKSLGYCYNQVESTYWSIYSYKLALEIKPDDLGSVVSLANLYIKDKKYAEGIDVTDGYRKLDSTNREVNSKNAYLYMLDKQYEIAIKKFKECLNAGDTTKFNYKNLGIAYYSINEYDEAKGFLEKAHTMDADDASTLHFLGISCYRSYYKELGILYLEEALKLYEPSEVKIALIYRNYAEACKGWDKCPSAKKISSALRAYELNPTDSTLAQNLGTEYEVVKDWAKAIQYYELYANTLKYNDKMQDEFTLKGRYMQVIEQLKAKLAKQTESVPAPK